MAKVTISFGGEVQGEHAVDQPVVVVGRDPTCGIRIDNLGISRMHCQFIKRGDSYLLQDMNSANGTYVNGGRVGEHTLSEGDEILIGKYTLKFSFAGEAAKASKPEDNSDMMAEPVHTYVMDGDKIRERLDQMRAAGGPPEEESEKAPEKAPEGEPVQKTPSTAKLPPIPGRLDDVVDPTRPVPATPVSTPLPGGSAPRRAIDHALDFDPLKPQSKRRPTSTTSTQRYQKAPAGGGMKILLYMSLATNLVLIALVAVLVVLLWKMVQQEGGLFGPGPGRLDDVVDPTRPPAAAPEVEPVDESVPEEEPEEEPKEEPKEEPDEGREEGREEEPAPPPVT